MSVLYHNPRCSKSRQTLALLEENGHQPQVVEYLKTPPTTGELTEILSLLGKSPLELIRTKEDLFKELGLSKSDKRPDEEWVQFMVNNPKLIERPIFVHDGKAAVGRPPENVLEIL